MTTFARVNFNSLLYKQFRPEYTRCFFEKVYAYHKTHGGVFQNALDVGTGTGQVASLIADDFEHVTATDPSQSMLNGITQHSKITYLRGSAEKLEFPDNSFDLITSAQSAHWFDFPAFKEEAKRVLRPNGTLAISVYQVARFPDYPRSSNLLYEYAVNYLESYWEPGRLKLMDGLKDYDLSDFKQTERHVYPDNEGPPLIEMNMSLNHLRMYMKTWSAHVRLMEKEHPIEDPSEVLVHKIAAEEGISDWDQPIRTVWPYVLILAKSPKS
eukprot:TRINITY_DN8903_c0_g1_i1.p1 TRINITY_DN8903_c0_g1~~TRINITY_DN8903_c0_g1_i1.p1  ORF type:complete len:269 (-),score=35.29 TRINITY_DN8903_c0_g1_i1:40-846(-)